MLALPFPAHPTSTHPFLSLLEIVARLVPKNNRREREQVRERKTESKEENNNRSYFPPSLLFNPAFFFLFPSPTLIFKLPPNSWTVIVPHSPFSAEITFLPSQTLACWGSKFHLPSPLCPLVHKHTLITCAELWRKVNEGLTRPCLETCRYNVA